MLSLNLEIKRRKKRRKEGRRERKKEGKEEKRKERKKGRKKEELKKAVTLPFLSIPPSLKLGSESSPDCGEHVLSPIPNSEPFCVLLTWGAE
jgi:hypothetical protein